MPWDGYSTRISEIAGKYNIPVQSLLVPLQHAYRTHGSKLFIPWDGHNSAIANQVIAQAIAQQISGDIQTDR
jgi:hypothetical protein